MRAFGNGSYPCKENGRRAFCQFPLEDRETVHLHTLASGQGCPLSLVPSPLTVSPSNSSESLPASSNNDDASKKGDQETEGVEGFSIPLHIQIDPAVLTLLQQQQNEASTHQNNPTTNSLLSGNKDTILTSPSTDRKNATQSITNTGESQVQDKRARGNGGQKNVNRAQVGSVGSVLLSGILGLLAFW